MASILRTTLLSASMPLRPAARLLRRSYVSVSANEVTS